MPCADCCILTSGKSTKNPLLPCAFEAPLVVAAVFCTPALTFFKSRLHLQLFG